MTMTHDKEDSTGEIVSHNAGHALDVLGIAASLAGAAGSGAVAGVAAGSIGAVKLALSAVERRRQSKREGNVRRLLEDLGRRLADVEQASQDEVRIDLFAELIANAVREDEAAKVDFHSALIAWVVKEEPPTAKVRLLGQAILQLSCDELKAFVSWAGSAGGKAPLFTDVDERVFWARLQSAGLFAGAGGVIHQNNITSLGRDFLRICEGLGYTEEEISSRPRR
ncbi:MAG: hypothetical protein ACF8NJ_05905 [Phycisphaerales bacterium JB038]